MSKKNLKFFRLSLIVLALLCCFAGCAPNIAPPTGNNPDDPDVTEVPKLEHFKTVVTAEDIHTLEDYPDLKTLDLSGSTCYPEILAYMEAHPDVEVTYTVDILGTTYKTDTEELNLSDLTVEQLTEVAPTLRYLPNLKKVELMKADGTSNFAMTDIKALCDACPGVVFNYKFDLFGKTFSTADEYIEFVDQEIGDEGITQIREAMDIMPNLYSVKLDKCGVSSEVMAKLRDDYPDVKVVWRVYFGTKFNCLTDEEVLRLTDGLYDDNISEMKYLTEARFVDIGHNDKLTDISFCKYMPNLELLIVSGAAVKDLTPLENAKKLEYLELVFCGNLVDLTPLENCTALKYLNISNTKVKDLTPLDNLPIERFNCLSMKYLPSSQRDHFKSKHPECLSVFNGTQPYGYGWRYVDNGYTFWEYYANMRIIFNYDNKYWYTGRT